jgi:hypothetical protein
MEGFCGGISVQWNQNNGRCGICGDNFALGMPRPHELGGTYGQGVIVKTYRQGQTIEVSLKLSASHLGSFIFKICNLDAERETEESFRHVLYNYRDQTKL